MHKIIRTYIYIYIYIYMEENNGLLFDSLSRKIDYKIIQVEGENY